MKQLRTLMALCAFLISACNLLQAEKVENMPYEGGCSIDGVKPKLNLAPLIKGRVADLAGASLPVVYVLEKGTANGTDSDVNRRYSFSANEGVAFAFSFDEGYPPPPPPPPSPTPFLAPPPPPPTIPTNDHQL